MHVCNLRKASRTASSKGHKWVKVILFQTNMPTRYQLTNWNATFTVVNVGRARTMEW